MFIIPSSFILHPSLAHRRRCLSSHGRCFCSPFLDTFTRPRFLSVGGRALLGPEMQQLYSEHTTSPLLPQVPPGWTNPKGEQVGGRRGPEEGPWGPAATGGI